MKCLLKKSEKNEIKFFSTDLYLKKKKIINKYSFKLEMRNNNIIQKIICILPNPFVIRRHRKLNISS